jgi:flagellar basal body P-ring protein FlgI
MTPTPNKDININFRVTEQRKLKLQKEAITKIITLSDLLNKIIEKYFEPPIDKKANHQEAKTVEGEKIDNKGM